MSNQPWICPSCNRGVAPGEKTCDHGGELAAPPNVIIRCNPLPAEPIGPNTSPPYPDVTTSLVIPGPDGFGKEGEDWNYTH